MATSKKSTGNNNSLTIVASLLIGALGMYIAYPYLVPAPTLAYTKDMAKVNTINGLYVFIECAPVDGSSYDIIETFKGDNVLDVVNSLGIGKEDIGTVIENVLKASSENINLHAQLDKLTVQIRDKYPNAQGLIISKEIKRCEVIVFK